LCNSVRFICPVLAQISGDRELIINIFLNFSLGIGASLIGLIDSLFQIELLLSSQEVKDALILSDGISVHLMFLCGMTHNDIIALSLKIQTNFEHKRS
jgi:hypothetical protein